MRLLRFPDAEALNLVGASMIAALVRAKSDLRIVPATGNTPMGLYAALAAQRREGAFLTERLVVCQLDAYLGLTPDDPRSLFRWMVASFVEPLGVPLERVVRLRGDAEDPAEACAAYDREVKAGGGLDLAILGLGPNGHLGFNEPPSSDRSPTRVVTLTPESVQSNGAYWGGEEHVPRQALTAGMDLLLSARTILLLVSGAHKRQILRAAVEEPVTETLPASYLQLCPHAIVLADAAALEG